LLEKRIVRPGGSIVSIRPFRVCRGTSEMQHAARSTGATGGGDHRVAGQGSGGAKADGEEIAARFRHWGSALGCLPSRVGLPPRPLLNCLCFTPHDSTTLPLGAIAL